MASLPSNEHTLELLAERAAYGLDEQHEQELTRQLTACDGVDPDAFDAAAAAISVALIAAEGPLPALPSNLRQSLRVASRAFTNTAAESPTAEPKLRLAPQATLTDPDPAAVTQLRREGSVPAIAWVGWLAAAASLLVAVLVRTPPQSTSPAKSIESLIASASDLIEAPWLGLAALGFAETPHPLDQGVIGNVVWSDDRNEGYMQIEGLAPNDASEFQYQLWIFDATRPIDQLPQFASDAIPLLSQRPVDGGVFDFTPGPDGKAIIPIDPKLRVGKGAIFAITVEPPGGVVVSDRNIVFAAVRG